MPNKINQRIESWWWWRWAAERDGVGQFLSWLHNSSLHGVAPPLDAGMLYRCMLVPPASPSGAQSPAHCTTGRVSSALVRSSALTVPHILFDRCIKYILIHEYKLLLLLRRERNFVFRRKYEVRYWFLLVCLYRADFGSSEQLSFSSFIDSLISSF